MTRTSRGIRIELLLILLENMTNGFILILYKRSQIGVPLVYDAVIRDLSWVTSLESKGYCSAHNSIGEKHIYLIIIITVHHHMHVVAHMRHHDAGIMLRKAEFPGTLQGIECQIIHKIIKQAACLILLCLRTAQGCWCIAFQGDRKRGIKLMKKLNATDVISKSKALVTLTKT